MRLFSLRGRARPHLRDRLRSVPLSFGFPLLFIAVALLPTGAAHPSTVPGALPASPSSDPAAGLAWVHLHHPNASLPSPRTSSAMAYDPSASVVLLFGGCGPTDCPMNDTWSFSSGLWTNLTGTTDATPAARSGAVLAYDPSTGGELLFGGCAANGAVLSDSWLFLNESWTRVSNSTLAPTARCDASVTTNPAANAVDLFGGRASGGVTLGDLWQFADGNWTLRSTPGAETPTPRTNASFSYDPLSGTLVVFGGNGSGGSLRSDSWRFDQGSWSALNVTAGGSPPARENAFFVTVPPLSGELLFGGRGPTGLLGDSWLFQNGSWSNLSPGIAHPPTPRSDAASAFDLRDGYAVMEGGRTSSGGYRNDTWAFVLPLTAQVAPPTVSVVPGQVVELSVNVSGGLPPYHYNWSFGTGGPPVREVAPYFAFPSAGDYAINVSVTDNRGALVSSSETLRVSLPSLSVHLLVTPARVSLGATVQVSGAISGGSPPYQTNFAGLPGGCSSGGRASFSCSPHAAGDYLVTVRVVDAAGAVASATAALVIGPASGVLPTASLSPGPAAFQHWGWVLVPPLGAAVAMAAYASLVSYRIATTPPSVAPERPECYVPPDWSETPASFDLAPSQDPSDGSTGRR